MSKEELQKKFEEQAKKLFPDEFYSSMAQRAGAVNVDRSEERAAFIKGCWEGYNARKNG